MFGGHGDKPDPSGEGRPTGGTGGGGVRRYVLPPPGAIHQSQTL